MLLAAKRKERNEWNYMKKRLARATEKFDAQDHEVFALELDEHFPFFNFKCFVVVSSCLGCRDTFLDIEAKCKAKCRLARPEVKIDLGWMCVVYLK